MPQVICTTCLGARMAQQTNIGGAPTYPASYSAPRGSSAPEQDTLLVPCPTCKGAGTLWT